MTLTATAPGFTQAQGTATVGESGLRLRVPDIDDDVVDGFGVLREHRGAERGGQFRCVAAAAGRGREHDGDGQSQNTAVASAGHDRRDWTVADGDDCRGAVELATCVATGGVAFDPLAAGATTVSATAPGFRPRRGRR